MVKCTLNYFLLFTITVVVLLGSCRKKDVDTTPSSSHDVWVINEGSFGSGLGNVTAYRSHDNDVIANPVESANGTALGDVAQSAYLIDGDAWVVINNSNKILILDTATFEIKDQITNINTPKFGCLSGDFFYIGSLFSDEFYQISTSTKNVQIFHAPGVGILDVVQWNGKICLAISDTSNNKLYEFDPADGQFRIVASLNEGYAPFDLEVVDDHLIALSGSSWMGVDFRFTKVYDVDSSRTFTPASNAEYVSIASHAGNTYFLANDYSGMGSQLNGVFQLNMDDDTGDFSYSERVTVPSGVAHFYTMGIHPSSGEFYMSDAKSYTVNGQIYIFDPNGHYQNDFEAGIVPGFFFFKN